MNGTSTATHARLADRSLARVLWDNLRIGVPVCLAVALFITLLFRDGFVRNLVFSLCIGLTIQALVQLGRHLGTARLRRQGLAGPQLDQLWPGWSFMGPWIAASALLGYTVGSLLGSAMLGLPGPLHMLANPRALAIVLVITLVAAGVTTQFYVSRGRLMAAEAATQAAHRAAAENQLLLLQTQLEPHMLFNTLANLRVLIGADPPRAQAMLDSLIAFLRATLGGSRATSHPLSAEFDRLADYLALMAVRMGPRLQTRLDLPAELRQRPVPPLLLQPLVENCIKHGLEPKLEGGRVEVRARRVGHMLELSVRDTGVGLAAPGGQPGSGVGTLLVRDRLAALYGPKASFTLQAATDKEGGTLATLHLPLDDDGSAAPGGAGTP